MQRRDFLGLGLGALAASTPLRAASLPSGKPQSRLARRGYLPNIPLVTHEGERVHFYDDLIHGKTVMFNFFLVACSDGVCPVGIRNMRKAQDILGERMGRDIFFYSITLQPRTDTVPVLREYVKSFDIRPGWLFLTGGAEDIELLRRRQGFTDPDPEIDQDLTNHVAMARFGSDYLERWSSVALRSSPENLASSVMVL